MEANNLTVKGKHEIKSSNAAALNYNTITFEEGGEMMIDAPVNLNCNKVVANNSTKDVVLNFSVPPYDQPAPSGANGPSNPNGMGGDGAPGASGANGRDMSPVSMTLGVVEGNLIVKVGGWRWPNGWQRR